jgi:ATP/maltotriose-dependent transcriptional regulator MalT
LNYWIGYLYRRTAEMEQMMENLLDEMKADKEQMGEEMKTNGGDMKANQEEMKSEVDVNKQNTEANLEEMKTTVSAYRKTIEAILEKMKGCREATHFFFFGARAPTWALAYLHVTLRFTSVF